MNSLYVLRLWTLLLSAVTVWHGNTVILLLLLAWLLLLPVSMVLEKLWRRRLSRVRRSLCMVFRLHRVSWLERRINVLVTRCKVTPLMLTLTLLLSSWRHRDRLAYGLVPTLLLKYRRLRYMKLRNLLVLWIRFTIARLSRLVVRASALLLFRCRHVIYSRLRPTSCRLTRTRLVNDLLHTRPLNLTVNPVRSLKRRCTTLIRRRWPRLVLHTRRMVTCTMLTRIRRPTLTRRYTRTVYRRRRLLFCREIRLRFLSWMSYVISCRTRTLLLKRCSRITMNMVLTLWLCINNAQYSS